TASSPEPAVRYDYKKKTSAARLESLLAARESLRDVREDLRPSQLPLSPRSTSPQDSMTLPLAISPGDQHIGLPSSDSRPAVSLNQPLAQEVKTVLLEQAFVQQQQGVQSGGGMWLPQMPGNCIPALPHYLQPTAALEVAFKGSHTLAPPAVATQFNHTTTNPFIGGNSLWLYMQPSHGVLVPDKLPPVPKLQVARAGGSFDAAIGRCTAEDQHAFTMRGG
ncbi:hypothetical protein BIW11_07916, partial [Tropilaelaps mercedesae]